MALSKVVLLAIVLVGLAAVGSAFVSHPRRPTGPFNPPIPTTPPFFPRYRRSLGVDTLDYQYEPVAVDGARFRRFSVPIVVVPMPAPPPPPPMA